MEKIEIKKWHLKLLRERYPLYKDMSDDKIIEALLFWEKLLDRKSLLESLCFPTFDCALDYIKNKKPTLI